MRLKGTRLAWWPACWCCRRRAYSGRSCAIFEAGERSCDAIITPFCVQNAAVVVHLGQACEADLNARKATLFVCRMFVFTRSITVLKAPHDGACRVLPLCFCNLTESHCCRFVRRLSPCRLCNPLLRCVLVLASSRTRIASMLVHPHPTFRPSLACLPNNRSRLGPKTSGILEYFGLADTSCMSQGWNDVCLTWHLAR